MDDFIGFVVFVLILVPLSMFVLLLMLLSRQKRYQEEAGQAMQAIMTAIDEQGARLRELSSRLHHASTEQPLQSANLEALTSVDDSATEEAGLAENSISAAELSKPEDAAVDPWYQTESVQMPPSRFELAARQILQEIWNWIIVGEGHRPQGMSMEYAVASNWLLRVGVLILVTGIGFFLKYSIDNQLLGEQARVAISVLAGVGMIVGGVRLVGGTYHLFSQGLLGGGIAVLYFSVFAAYSFYHLLAVYPTFALMIMVTACAATLAIRLDSMLVAIFAIIGGYCTPILLSTGEVNFAGLFGYMLLLGVGILGINWYKQWHLLNFLSFFFNYLLFFGAMQTYHIGYFWQVFPYLCGFFILYSTTVFLFCLANSVKANLLDLLALIVNAGIFFATAYYLIEPAYGQVWVALLSVLLAAFYIGHAYYCLALRLTDKGLLLCFMGLAAFFLAISLPLFLSKQWITVSWSVQALVMLWLAGKLQSAFLRQLAYLLYMIVVVRFCLATCRISTARLLTYSNRLSDFLLACWNASSASVCPYYR